MPFEPKVIGHRAIPIGEVPISGLVAVSPRQQCTQSQQRKLVHHEPGIGRDSCQPLDGRLCFRSFRGLGQRSCWSAVTAVVYVSGEVVGVSRESLPEHVRSIGDGLQSVADASLVDPTRLLADVVGDAAAGVSALVHVRLFMLLATGLVARTTRRTVVGMLAGAGVAALVSFHSACRFFSQYTWDTDRLGLAIARLIVEQLLPATRPSRPWWTTPCSAAGARRCTTRSGPTTSPPKARPNSAAATRG